MDINDDSKFSATFDVKAKDESGKFRQVAVAGERPFTIKINGDEIVTIMTLGTHIKALVIGYLRNQHFIKSIDDIVNIDINWQKELANVITKKDIVNLQEKISKRTITTGCGQGTVFNHTMEEIYKCKLNYALFKQSNLYKILKNLSNYNKIYRSAGAVHSCALCTDEKTIIFIEDIGRHNAADAIAGIMWLDNIKVTDNLYFYTTGRITSEIVIKVSQMGLSVLISRSGITQMGLELAQDLDIIVISRAKGRHFLLFSGFKRFVFDETIQK